MKCILICKNSKLIALSNMINEVKDNTSLLFPGYLFKSRLCINPFCLQQSLATILNTGKWKNEHINFWTFPWINNWNWEGNGSISGIHLRVKISNQYIFLVKTAKLEKTLDLENINWFYTIHSIFYTTTFHLIRIPFFMRSPSFM